MKFEDLTPEQQAKAKECKSADELRTLAEAEGLPLSDEELNAIAGGKWGEGWLCHDVCSDYTHCPQDH